MFVRKTTVWIVCVLLIGLVLGGCGSPAVAPSPMLSPLAVSESTARPAPTAQTLVSPLPMPTPVSTAMRREAGKGAVSGVLERYDGTLLKGIIVYAALIEERNGVRLAAVDPQIDPRSTTDGEGRFAFPNLAPGEYALATQSPVGIIMPHNKEGAIVRFTVQPDAELDLGRLAVGYLYPDNE